MEQAFGGSDSQGTWDWKGAYDTCEVAAVPVPAQVRSRYGRTRHLVRCLR
jgi:hypothetical protein